MPDPYEEFEDHESALRLAMLGAGIGGALGLLRSSRRMPAFFNGRSAGHWVRRQDPAPLLASPWWEKAWVSFESRTASLLVSLSRDSGSRLIRSFSARIAEGLSDRVAEDFARSFAADLARIARESTGEGMASAMRALASQDTTNSVLEDQLAERLGPTVRQLEGRRGIHRFERRELRKISELPANERRAARRALRRRVKRRALTASQQRARVWASDTLVRTVSQTESNVYQAAGLLIFSWNPLDHRTRPLHGSQTQITRATPTPAGQPWTAAAPFRGLPPYEALCRCRPRSA